MKKGSGIVKYGYLLSGIVYLVGDTSLFILGIRNRFVLLLFLIAGICQFLIFFILRVLDKKKMEDGSTPKKERSKSNLTYETKDSEKNRNKNTGDDIPEDTRLQALELKQNGESVRAVKLIREKTGMGLVEAKEYIDSL